MERDLNTFCYIQEQTSFPEDYSKFGYEYHDMGSRFFLTFPAVLQSFGVQNRNRREYEAENIMNCIQNDEYIQTMLKQNSWMGEIDHPAPEREDEKLTMNRIANPNMKQTSHYVRSPRLVGNLLWANIQTDSSNEHGMNMAIKIVDGKIIPCFSARVFGEARNKGNRVVVFVRKLICYDWVLYPSHAEATGQIRQPLMESVQRVVDKAAAYAGAKVIFLKELAQMAANNSKETELLCESFGLTIDDVVGITSTGNSVVIQENGTNVYIQPISDKFIRQKTQNALRDWIHR